jgi:hypothetical protein
VQAITEIQVGFMLWLQTFHNGALGDALIAFDLTLFGLWITFAMPWLLERIHLSD